MGRKIFAVLFVLTAITAPVGANDDGLALQLIFEAGRVEAPDEKATLYRRTADECGDTPLAQEALWRLSQLYVDGFDEPKMKEAVSCLEEFTGKYPHSEWLSNVEMTLLGYYESEKLWKKFVSLGQKILEDKNMPKKYKDEIATRVHAARAKN